MADKTTAGKLAKATEKLKAVKGGEDAVALRAAKKKVKRAQRKLKVEKIIGARKEAYGTNRQKNLDKAAEKAAKLKAAKEAALNAAAEKAAGAGSAE
ncbi:MAG: hypothetical protein HY751_02925 [Nitrospinae bacterium]|nr:hypothetical protein [Nitrospinota bacterium]